VPAAGDLPEPVAPHRRPRWPAAVLALVLLVAGAVGGYAWWQEAHETKTFTDADGVLSVTVPSSWARQVSLKGWTPPDSPYTQSALSVGNQASWRTAATGQGVFVGLLPEDRLPKRLPTHPACRHPGAPQAGTKGDPSLTATSTGCPGVIIERAVQVTSTMLMWVQVRSADTATAERVLSSVSARQSLG
jgi:hypothetical protein